MRGVCVARKIGGKAKPPHLFPKGGGFVLATSYSRTTYRRTTIGAAAFHFRVRNGNGWVHCAMITRLRCRSGGLMRRIEGRSAPISGAGGFSVAALFSASLSKNYRFSDVYIQEVFRILRLRFR